MLCPRCKKIATSIVSEKYDKKTNSVKRNYKCVCGKSFETSEKIKKLEKRKPKKNTEWKDARFCHYAITRLTDCIDDVVNEVYSLFFGSKKFKHEEANKQSIKYDMFKENAKKRNEFIIKMFKEGITKKGGKLFFKLPIEQGKFDLLIAGKKLNKIKLKTKIETINSIVKDVHYWEVRNLFLNKPIEDMENKSIFRKEIKEFYKSVCDYIKQPKYNKNFFIHYQPQAKRYWNDYWDFYLKIR